MRFRAALPFLCPALVLLAASPWEDFQQRHRNPVGRAPRWTLCVRSADFSNNDAINDVTLQRLILGGDLALEPLASAEAKDLWNLQNWGNEPHWVLLSPAGDLVCSLPGAPQGTAVLEALRAAGGRPRWEVRTAFLKDHPDQGEARLEEISQEFRLLRTRLLALDRQGKVRIPVWHQDGSSPRLAPLSRVSLPGDPDSEARNDDLCADVARSLGRLFTLPGWPHEVGAVTAQLMFWDLSAAPVMRDLFRRLVDRAEQLFQRDPYDYDLANFWMEAKETARLAPEGLAGTFTAVPGRPWPPPAILTRLLEPYRRREDWDGAVKILDSLAPAGRPEPLTPVAWEDTCRLQSAILAQKTLALASRGSWEMAAATLEDARQWGGSQGVREALFMRGSQFAGTAAELVTWRTLLNQVLSQGGARPAMPALEPPLRVVVMGAPKWIMAWSELQRAPELAPWSPGELRWEAASREAHEKWQQRFHWPAGPRWALFRGEDLRATGEDCPTPLALASSLELEGPALLQRYQKVLQAEPEHLAAHRARYEALLLRMPDRRLEGLLAQDAATAQIALEFDPQAAWKPDPDLWAAAAQEVLPKVEEELRCWPSRATLWHTWITWARFHPARPSILALAQSLPYWSPLGDWRAGLPYVVQRAVADELRHRGDFDVMRTWFRAAWDGVDQRPLAALRRGEREWVLEMRKEEETAIFQPLREALRALRCTQEQVELERVFAEMMGRDAGRRR